MMIVGSHGLGKGRGGGGIHLHSKNGRHHFSRWTDGGIRNIHTSKHDIAFKSCLYIIACPQNIGWIFCELYTWESYSIPHLVIQPTCSWPATWMYSEKIWMGQYSQILLELWQVISGHHMVSLYCGHFESGSSKCLLQSPHCYYKVSRRLHHVLTHDRMDIQCKSCLITLTGSIRVLGLSHNIGMLACTIEA